MKAVLLFSGGLDSTTLLAKLLADPDIESIVTLSAGYNSLHQEMEQRATYKILNHYHEEHKLKAHKLIVLPDVFEGSGSALMGESIMPEGPYEVKGPSPTVVPFRNGVLIASAAAYVASYGDGAVFIAAHASDAYNYAYPDCTPAFLEPMATALEWGTAGKVGLFAPFTQMTKAGVVNLGHELGVPFELTYSCYRGRTRACGKCPTCVERLAAFAANGLVDPAEYEVPNG
jgi:7-cyano-7-deazaguanine synthase